MCLIFILEWKSLATRYLLEIQTAKTKGTRDELFKRLREKANDIYKDYLMPTSPNLLSIDSGLIETLSIRIRNDTITPDQLWFDSMCKYVYEKMKNEEMFLSNFYQSPGYRKLLFELEFLSNSTETPDLDTQQSHLGGVDTGSAGSDSNSGDIQFDEDFEFDFDGMSVNSGTNVPTSTVVKAESNEKPSESLIGTTFELGVLPILGLGTQGKHLDVGPFKHSRSHSDCTGMNISDVNTVLLQPNTATTIKRPQSAGKTSPLAAKPTEPPAPVPPIAVASVDHSKYRQKLDAKIINTAINCEEKYAVYTIQVTVIEDNQQKIWHVYRRYSGFLDLKKILVKRVSQTVITDHTFSNSLYLFFIVYIDCTSAISS